MSYEKHITRITVMPKGESVCTCEATNIEIRDTIDFLFSNVCNKLNGGTGK